MSQSCKQFLRDVCGKKGHVTQTKGIFASLSTEGVCCNLSVKTMQQSQLSLKAYNGHKYNAFNSFSKAPGSLYKCPSPKE